MSSPDNTAAKEDRPAGTAPWQLPTLLLAGAIVFAGYYLGLLHGRPVLWSDSYEYALAGRGLAEGRGLTTDSATVMEFAMLYRGALPVPYYFHDVGNSLLHAAMYLLLGSSDSVIPAASGLCFILLAPATFVLGRRLFGAPVGGLATALVLTNAQLLAHSTTGLSETPTALGLTVLLTLLAAPPAALSAVKRVTAGAAFGALVVLRSNAILFLPWLCLFSWTLPGEESGGSRPSSRASSRALVLFLAGFGLVWGPVAIRNQMGLGRPLANVASYYIPFFHTSAIPVLAQDVYSSPRLDVDAPLTFFAEHPGEMASKVLWQLGRLVPELLRGGGLWVKNDWVESVLLFLFVLGMVVPPPRETVVQRRGRWLLIAMVGTSVVVGLAVFLRWRHLYAFLPVVLVYDAEVILRVFGKGDQGSLTLGPAGVSRLTLVVAVLAALGWGRLAGDVGGAFAKSSRANNDYYQAVGEFLRQNTRRSAVVLVRCPHPLSELRALGWYGRRQLVEHSPSTEKGVLARPGPAKVFFLATSGPGDGRPVDGIPGWPVVARWGSGSGDHAALFAAPQ